VGGGRVAQRHNPCVSGRMYVLSTLSSKGKGEKRQAQRPSTARHNDHLRKDYNNTTQAQIIALLRDNLRKDK
jgi:hypothetical protein